MSYADEERAIYERLSANWSTTPIKYGDIPLNDVPDSPWVALTIQGSEAKQIDLGVSNPLVRHGGRIVMQIFAPEVQGVRLSKQYADTLGAVFANEEFSAGSSGTIRCRRATISTVPARHGWSQVNVDIPFVRDKHF